MIGALLSMSGAGNCIRNYGKCEAQIHSIESVANAKMLQFILFDAFNNEVVIKKMLKKVKTLLSVNLQVTRNHISYYNHSNAF